MVFLFFLLFINFNFAKFRNYFFERVGETSIIIENQLKAIDYIFKDSEKKGSFNVDVYVPPVIPHAYDYLFLWQGEKRCGEDLCGLRLSEQVPLLYTLYEEDPPHPERLNAWLERQKGIGIVEEERNFGGITVERRKRI